MYVETEDFSSQFRQGDVLYGRAILYPDVQIRRVRELAEATSADGNDSNINLEAKIKSDHFVILSQCCDIERDSRVLIAQTLPERAIRWEELGEVRAEAFKQNELGVNLDSESGKQRVWTSADGFQTSETEWVLPGRFFLEPCPGVFEEGRVVAFAMSRGIRQADLAELEKVAELNLESRARLRRRLGIWLSRVPEEDFVS